MLFQALASCLCTSLQPLSPLVTGQTLRCDVFVASIVAVEITTRTRELLLGEEPERFEVQAFDEEGKLSISVRAKSRYVQCKQLVCLVIYGVLCHV